MLLCKKEAFDGKHTLHSKRRHVAAYCQCPPPPNFEDEGLSHINCARGECDDYPSYCPPVLETQLKAGDKKIFFYNYKKYQLVLCVESVIKEQRSVSLVVKERVMANNRGLMIKSI